MVQILNLLVLFLLFLALSDVYNINKKFAMAPHLRNQNAREAMSWLKSYDDGLYYVNLGGTNIYWDWMAYAYEMEIPVMNFPSSNGFCGQDFAPANEVEMSKLCNQLS